MNKIFWKLFYALSSLIGIVSAVWGYETFLITFINPGFLLAICLTPTALVFVLIRKHYSTLYGVKGTHFPFFQSLLSAGLLATSIFLIGNCRITTSKPSTEIHSIMETGALGGKHNKPYAIIERGDHIKKLVFKQNPIINSGDHVQLTVQRGYFGFDIITKQQIVKASKTTVR